MDNIKNIFGVSGKSGKSKTLDDTSAILLIAVVIGVLLVILYCLNKKNNQQQESILENFKSEEEENVKRLMEIILLPRLPSEDRDYKYLGLFSSDTESSLYLSTDLKRGIWEGPLKHSMPMDSNNIEYKIKHITLNADGELMCIDENNKIWFKPHNISDLSEKGESNDTSSLDEKWRDDWITDRSFNRTSYIMFAEREISAVNTQGPPIPDEQTQTPIAATSEPSQDLEVIEKYYVIGKDGSLNIHKYVRSADTSISGGLGSSRTLEPMNAGIPVKIVDDNGSENSNNPTGLIKIFKESDGHLLGLFEDNKLRISKLKEKDFHIKLKNRRGGDDSPVLEFREIHNKNILFDVLYDKNKMMYGIGQINGNPLLLKQTSTSYLGEFLPLFKLNSKLEDTRVRLSYRDIIYLKNGYSPRNDIKMPTLDDSYMAEKNKDMTEFRKFCKDRHPKNYHNFRINKQISEFNQKIENLKEFKEKLVALDSRKRLQDDTPG
jgi:hypothetical protein